MKKFIAEINIMLHPEILDSQGKAVSSSMHNLNLSAIDNVRIGKHITLEVEAQSAEEACSKVDEACKKLLANLIMERYEFSVKEVL
jgi:phosphoribosylformylglycinamidine synthase